MKALHIAAYTLLWVGGLNWGLVGLFDFNLVNSLLGIAPAIERLVYVLVGAAAVYVVATHMGQCRGCGKS
jgi:uncharacterized membrane protein YuzA (DUF378 family)